MDKQVCLSETNLLVFFGHPLVPTVEHIQPFGFSLPEHFWRNISTALREQREIRSFIWYNMHASTPTHTRSHVSNYRVGNREPVLVQNRCSWHSVLLTVMAHLHLKKILFSNKAYLLLNRQCYLNQLNNSLPHWTGRGLDSSCPTWFEARNLLLCYV